jgi:hypothetical protein
MCDFLKVRSVFRWKRKNNYLLQILLWPALRQSSHLKITTVSIILFTK